MTNDEGVQVGYFQAWGIGAFGSLLGGMVTSYYLGDKNVREKILIASPFMIIGVIGVFQIFTYFKDK